MQDKNLSIPDLASIRKVALSFFLPFPHASQRAKRRGHSEILWEFQKKSFFNQYKILEAKVWENVVLKHSVQTEAHLAGESPASSGRSFGRGSSGTNFEYPVLTGPPVSTRAPAINRSFCLMWGPYDKITLIVQQKFRILAIKCYFLIVSFCELVFKPLVIARGSGVTGAFGCNRGLTGASSPAGNPWNLCAGAPAPAGGQNSASVWTLLMHDCKVQSIKRLWLTQEQVMRKHEYLAR